MKNKLLIILSLASIAGFVLMISLIPSPSWWEYDLMLCVFITFLVCILALTKKKKPNKDAEKYIQKAINLLNKMDNVKKTKSSLYLVIIRNDIAFAVDRLNISIKYYEKYELKFAIESLIKIASRYEALSDHAEKLNADNASNIYKTDIQTLEKIRNELCSLFSDKKK